MRRSTGFTRSRPKTAEPSKKNSLLRPSPSMTPKKAHQRQARMLATPMRRLRSPKKNLPNVG